MSKKMTLDMLKKVISLENAIDKILESCSFKYGVGAVCNKYKQLLNEGKPEELLYKGFLNEMSIFNSISAVNTELLLLEKRINENKNEIEIIKVLHEMYNNNDFLAPIFESDVVYYLVNKDTETTNKLKETLGMFGSDKNATKILESVTMDEYTKKINGTVKKLMLNENAETERLYTKDEVKHLIKTKIKENTIKESEANSKLTINSLENRVRLQSSITNILNKVQHNEKLKSFCESYQNELRNGKSDVFLYESFISGASQWNYLNAVDTEMSALKERISKYKQEIDLTKILETMNQTNSYYIVPIIESCVVSYMQNKNVATRAMLKQACDPFMFDPFVKDILNVVNGDISLNKGLYLGESLENLKSKVHTEQIYSPVLFIKENESIFNVDGTYYSKKGPHIIKLTKNDVRNISESFKHTCGVLNKSNVTFDEVSDSIKVYGDKDIANINEFGVKINGVSIKESEINNHAYQAILASDNSLSFVDDIITINENYGKISMLDFVKRVKLNEGNKSVDVFKIKNNISLSLTESNNTVFYRNVNPIQCKSYINEHMELTITPMFEELLPEQETIVNEIEETKKSYESYIEELKDKKSELESLKESDDVFDKDVLESAIKLVEDELNDVVNDYKKYQEDSDKYTGQYKEETEKEDDITDVIPDVETTELTQPITDEPDSISDVVDDTTSEEPVNIEYDPVLYPVSDNGFDIIKVTYNKNIKTDAIANKGTVNILIPSVNANGDIHDEIKSVTFTLDQDRKPIINNDYMTVVMYNAIKDAIINSPETELVDLNSTVDSVEDTSARNNVNGDVDLSLSVDGEKNDIDTLIKNNISTLDDVNTETIGYRNSDDLTTSLVNDTNSSIDDNVERETPEETRNGDVNLEKGESSITITFPIKIGLMFDEIKPISPEKFQDDLDQQNIEFTLSNNPKPGIIIDINNKAEMYFIKEYFKTWLNINDGSFFGAFPELKCFESLINNYGKTINNKNLKTYESSITLTLPVRIGLTFDEIKPISPEKFQDDLDQQNIEFTLSNDTPSEIIIDINNEADMYFIKDYFKTSLNINDGGFFGAFPELKCFESAINNLEKKEEFKEVIVDLPFDENLSEILDNNEFNVKIEDDEVLTITISTEDDLKDFKKILKEYAKDNEDLSDDMSKAIDDILIDDIIDVVFDYDGMLINALEKKSIKYNETDDDKIIVSVLSEDDAEELLDVIDGTDIIPENLDELTEFAGLEKIEKKELTEGVKITVEDTKTNKKVVIDTDDLNVDDDKDNNDDEDEDDREKDKDEDEDEDKENKDDEKEENNDSNDSVSFNNDTELFKEPKTEPEEKEKKEESSEPKKKVFKFKPKSKLTESLKSLNESVTANVLDRVYYKGKVGTVTGKQADGKFIVLTDGSTHVCDQSELKLTYNKLDLVEPNFKYDEKTLSGLYEQLVQCGIFMNGTQLTPNNCFCKYSDYKKAELNEEVRVILDGQFTSAKKQHIKIMEDVNEFANIKEYIDGVTLDNQGKAVKNILINAVDYGNSKDDSDMVRVLLPDETGKTELITMPKYSIKTLAI